MKTLYFNGNIPKLYCYSIKLYELLNYIIINGEFLIHSIVVNHNNE